ncbi:MAG: hypothetical protein JWN08_2428 [Frankiales bacterium]|nr:hypothetical protein [Frankiales bacterium]
MGFVHLSFAWQVEATAQRYYADLDEPPLLLRVDPRLLEVPVRVEPAAGSGEGFAHVYGPLPVTAVVDVRPLERVDGAWRSPAPWRVG